MDQQINAGRKATMTPNRLRVRTRLLKICAKQLQIYPRITKEELASTLLSITKQSLIMLDSAKEDGSDILVEPPIQALRWESFLADRFNEHPRLGQLFNAMAEHWRNNLDEDAQADA